MGQFFVTVGVRYVRFWYLENKRSKVSVFCNFGHYIYFHINCLTVAILKK